MVNFFDKVVFYYKVIAKKLLCIHKLNASFDLVFILITLLIYFFKCCNLIGLAVIHYLNNRVFLSKNYITVYLLLIKYNYIISYHGILIIYLFKCCNMIGLSYSIRYQCALIKIALGKDAFSLFYCKKITKGGKEKAKKY